jgi:hypothetical protein
MKILLLKENIYDYYVDDIESDMDDIYYILKGYFKKDKWILEGSFKEIEEKLGHILKKYPMDIILNRFLNSGLAIELEEK